MDEKQKTNEAMNKNSFVDWLKSHKKQLILAGISISTLIALFVGIKNKDSLEKLWNVLKEKIENANLYSDDWFDKVTDEKLEIEREKVRLASFSVGDNFNEACRLENLLRRFDKEMSKRAWKNEIPHAPSIHREHGWYLPNEN